MNTILHQFKKDVLRLRTCLFWWGIPLLLEVAHFLLSSVAKQDWNPLQIQISGSPLGFSLLVTLILVPILIQEDSLVDSSAFWLTRPISNLQLLGGKVLFLGALIVLMTLAKGLGLVAEGIAVGEVFHRTLLFFIKTGALVSYLALVSAVTPSFKKFVLYAILGPVVCAILMALAEMGLQLFYILLKLADAAIFHGPLNDLSKGFPAALHLFNGSEAQDRIILPVIFLIGACLICHQYLTRRTRVTLKLAVAVFPMVVLVETGYLMVRGFWA